MEQNFSRYSVGNNRETETRVKEEFERLKSQPVMQQNRTKEQLETDAKNAKYSNEQAITKFQTKRSEVSQKTTQLSVLQQQEKKNLTDMNQVKVLSEASASKYDELLSKANTKQKELLSDYVDTSLNDVVCESGSGIEDLVVKLTGLNVE